MSTLEDLLSKFVNLPKVEPLNVFKDADVTFNASILVCWDADDVFNAATDVFNAATDVSTLEDLDSKFVNLVSVEPLNVFNAATATPILPPPIDADNALIDAETEELKLVMLPVKSGISFLSEPSKYKVELPLA